MRLLRVISSEIVNSYREIKSKMGRNSTETARQVTPFGIDCVPVKNAIAIIGDSENGRNTTVLGYLNDKALKDLKAGELMMFSAEADGSIAASIISRNDGILELLGTGDFLVRYNELEREFNELNNKFNELVVNYNAAMAVMAAHTHSYAPGPLPPVQTGPSSGAGSASTPSIANINNAKHESIKTTQKGI